MRAGFPLRLRLLPEHAKRYDTKSKIVVRGREAACLKPEHCRHTRIGEPHFLVDFDLQLLTGGWIGDVAVLPLTDLQEWTGWDGKEGT